MATLTLFSESGSGGSLCDGIASRTAVNEVFSTIRSGNGTAADATQNQELVRLTSSGTINQFAGLYRYFISFSVPNLGGGVVTGAYLRLFGGSSPTGLGSADLHVA